MVSSIRPSLLAAARLAQVEADVEDRGGVGERADGEVVDAGLGVRAGGVQGEAAGGLQQRAARDEGHGLLGLARREVVQQDQVGARVERPRASWSQGVDLDLDRHVGEAVPYGLEGLRRRRPPRPRGCP